ncbi:MAG: TolC family protein [Calditrichia bacterium]
MSIKILPVFIFLFLSISTSPAQNNLAYYLQKGFQNFPVLQDYQNQQSINALQRDLIGAQHSTFQLSFTASYLFAPYFNNNGNFISTNPAPDAIGYDVGITNGGEYSALFNVERNILNGRIVNALQRRNSVKIRQDRFSYVLEKHKLRKQITDQYLTAYQSLLEYGLAKEVVNNLEKQLRITSELVEKGYESAQNYLLLKVESQHQTINLKETFQNYKTDLTELNSLCGIKDTAAMQIDSVDMSLKPALDSTHFIRQFTLDSLATVADQSVFETKYWPQVNLFINTGLNAVELDGIQRKFGFSAGINLSVPIYDGRQKSITRQQSRIARETISAYKGYSKTNLRVRRENAFAKIRSLKESLDGLETQITDYRNLIRISSEQLETGGISMIGYLTMLRNLIRLRKTKIEKKISYQMEINNFNYWNW